MVKKMMLTVIILFSIFGCENSKVKEGKKYYKAGDFAKAMVYFEDAITEDPENFDAYCNLAKTYQALGAAPNALRAYQLAYGIDSTNLDLLYHYGHLSYDKRFDKESERRAYRIFVKLLQSDNADKYSDEILEKLTFMRYAHKTVVDGVELDSHEHLYFDDKNLVYTQPFDKRPGIAGSRLFAYRFSKKSRVSPSELYEIGSAAHFDVNKKNDKIILIDDKDNNIEIRAANFDQPDSEILAELSDAGKTYVPGKIIVAKEVIFSAGSFQSVKRNGRKKISSEISFYTMDLDERKIHHVFTAMESPLPEENPHTIFSFYDPRRDSKRFLDDMAFIVSPDSYKLFFFRPESRQQRNKLSLWQYDFKAKKTDKLLSNVFQEITDIQISPSGRYLVFRSAKGRPNLNVFDLTDRRLVGMLQAGPTYSFLENDNFIFCNKDSIFTYNPHEKSQQPLVELNGASNVFAFVENGESVLYKYGDRLITIPIPPEKMPASQLVEIVQKKYQYARNW